MGKVFAFILAAAFAVEVFAALIGLAPARAAVAPPQLRRVMSLNLCTDQLVLQLLPPERISSVTYLSRSREHSFLSSEAFGVPVNHGTAEEILEQKPDLVIAGAVSTPVTRALLKKSRIALLEVPAANDFGEIRTVTRMVARAVGEEAKGETLLRHMDATLVALRAASPKRRIIVAGWDGSGDIPAKGTLFDAILAAAGGENVAARLAPGRVYGGYAAFDLEQLVAMRPDILAFGAHQLSQLDLARERLQHPLVRALYAHREILYAETLYACGLPQSADAARDLQHRMLAIMDSGHTAQ